MFSLFAFALIVILFETKKIIKILSQQTDKNIRTICIIILKIWHKKKFFCIYVFYKLLINFNMQQNIDVE